MISGSGRFGQILGGGGGGGVVSAHFILLSFSGTKRFSG